MRKGADKIVRRFDTAKQKNIYTAIGRKFYAERRTEWVVKAPALFKGTRSNRTPYERREFFPITDPIAVPSNRTQAQRDAYIKQHVKPQVQKHTWLEIRGHWLIKKDDIAKIHVLQERRVPPPVDSLI